jgi:hypothetical protein
VNYTHVNRHGHHHHHHDHHNPFDDFNSFIEWFDEDDADFSQRNGFLNPWNQFQVHGGGLFIILFYYFEHLIYY